MHQTIPRRGAGINLLAGLLLLAAAALGLGLSWQTVSLFFLQNPLLNGVISIVFLVGVAYAFFWMLRLQDEFRALDKLRRRFETMAKGRGPDSAQLEGLPRSMAAERVALYAHQTEMHCPPDGDSHAERVATSLALHSSVTRYIAGLLVFLGLLGTFIGLLTSITGIVEIMGAMPGSTDTDGLAMLDRLMGSIQAPLEGMGTAFSTSVFGLVTSLIIGFLHLQLSSAQTRYISRLESLDAALFLPAFAGQAGTLGAGALRAAASQAGGGPTSELFARYLEASGRQLKDNLDRLVEIVERTETMQADYREAMQAINQSVETTNTAIQRLSTNQEMIRETLAELAVSARSESESQKLMLGELKAVNEGLARQAASQAAVQSGLKDYHGELLRVVQRELGAISKLQDRG